MTSACLACLAPIKPGSKYHGRCLKALFGVPRLPAVDVEAAKFQTAALAMVGRSMTGVQEKISVGLERGATLRVAVEGIQFILKPPSQFIPYAVENEHVTTRLAAMVGIEVPPCALVPLKDGPYAFIARRFDRLPTGRKLAQEDFCQLAGKPPKDKYVSSLEQCASIVLRYSDEPIIEALKFFRLALFGWWTGNGDMHLKNLALLRDERGRVRLSPAYDLLSTVLIRPDDQLALSVDGTKVIRSRRRWLALAKTCQIKPRAAERELATMASAVEKCSPLIERSSLPPEQKTKYRELLSQRSAILARARDEGPAERLDEGVPARAKKLREALLRENPGLHPGLIVEPKLEDLPLWDYLVERGHAVHRMGGYALKNWLTNLPEDD